jgi:hypothetical protein
MNRKTVTIVTLDCPQPRDFHLEESRAERFAARVRAEGGTADVGPFKVSAEQRAVLSQAGVAVRKPIELPWAVPKKEGFKGEASGLYFHFYRTHDEAKQCERALKKEGKWIGPTRFLPGEAFHAGYI